jgi:hypothetical protein
LADIKRGFYRVLDLAAMLAFRLAHGRFNCIEYRLRKSPPQ